MVATVNSAIIVAGDPDDARTLMITQQTQIMQTQDLHEDLEQQESEVGAGSELPFFYRSGS